jgi:anti-sigma factor RsiW
VTEQHDFTDIELTLHAYVDGELPADVRAATQAATDLDPDLQRRVSELLASKAAFDGLGGLLLRLPIPDRLAAAARRPPGTVHSLARAGTPTGPRWKKTAMATAMAASVAIGLFLSHDRVHNTAVPVAAGDPVGDPVVSEALAARYGELAPVRRVSFTAATDAGTRDRFVSEALGNTMRAPDLSHAGFTLVGADLYDGAKGFALQLRYTDRERHLFTVYVHPGAGPDRFFLLQHQAVRICVWQNEDMSTVMSAELPTSLLFRLSSMTYSALAL